MDEAEKWKKRFEREREARKEAERVLEVKSREVYEVNQELRLTLEGLEQRVEERTAALSVAVENANKANKAKSAFLATMSHEIRTPMNAVIGLTDLCMRNTSPSPKQKKYLQKIHHSALALLRIINDILDFSKIEAGEMDIENTPFTLGQVFQNLSNLVAEKVREKKLEFVIKRSANLSENFMGDPVRLGQILLNLAYNAIKFTDQGHVVVSVDQREGDDGYVILEFSVSDSGIGMTDEQQEMLFKPFTQVDTSDTRKYEGTGLGLAIARNLVRRMDGDISVESEYGKGTVFSFHVRLALNSELSAEDYRLPKYLDGKSVLLCSADPISSRAIEKYLKDCGLSVDVVSTMDPGAISKEHYDLLVACPADGVAGCGEEAQAFIVALDDRIDKKIVVSNEEEEIALTLMEGRPFDAYIQKPVDPSYLFDTVLEVFGHEVMSELQNLDQTDQEFEALTPIQGARILLVEDNELNQQVARELLENAKLFVEVAGNGHEAIQMLKGADFDCVLMDIQMPIMGGYEATRIIRSSQAHENLPIIAMTANAMVADRKAAISAGMDDHVAKPINVHTLFSTLLRVIEHKERDLPITRMREVKDAEHPEIEGLNVQDSIANFGNAVDLYNELLKKFCFVAQGMKGDLGSAISSGDYLTAGRIAHTLKGLAATIGAQNLESTARSLEVELGLEEIVPAAVTTVFSDIELQTSDLINRIESFFDEGASQAGKYAVADTDQIYSQLQGLKELLESFDVEAEEKITQMLLADMDGKTRTILKEIGKKIERYQFEEATTLLEPVMAVFEKEG
ncbi:ATP-binding protein [Terasakiella sp. A23]|uniref:hybrid sensor histidine kinase/response regulator n=1 Tax=Terasakiella sp. FCG-A23 TaxID=3080561 RepID=UPI0029546B5E|nr:ATP-binding protein [Terasakiella sp. A23]MDV7340669.1 ATP-binding protein [Terasakiella sp. A23]